MNTNIGLLGRKIGMTQIFDENGNAVPVTAIDTTPSIVVQVKSKDSNDKYDAIQLAYDETAPRNVPDEVMKRAQGAWERHQLTYGRTSKAMRGHFFKAGEAAPRRFVREMRVADASEYEVGQEIGVDIFEQGDFVDVVGTSKGRGFTGVIKRHGFAMFPKSHGTHEWTRHGGSIGCRKPMHVRKGQRMAGQYGAKRITTQNLLVVKPIPEQNVLLIRGAVPGPNGGYVTIRKSIKKKKKG